MSMENIETGRQRKLKQQRSLLLMVTHEIIDSFLKQFIVDLMCTGDGDVPLYLRVADGNESDRAIFAQLIREFNREWNIDALFVADAALYSTENLEQMKSLRWLSRVPATIKQTQELLALDNSIF